MPDNPIVGVWKLISCDAIRRNGSVLPIYGKNPVGQLIVILFLLAIRSNNSRFDLLGGVPLARDQWPLLIRNAFTALTHDFAINKSAICIFNNIKLIQLTAYDTSVHFALGVIFRHLSLLTN